MLQPRIVSNPELILVGNNIKMSLADNKTGALWQSFMPRKRDIKNVQGTDLYSVEVYDSLEYFSNFNLHTTFTKWAAVKVSDSNIIPEKMELLKIPEGKYAVFNYQGSASRVGELYQEILTQWLPFSSYTLANRPHFAVMGEKYKNDSPDSEEEFWIPVQLKI